jgi:O-antigen/teichoic acid export membrane protein
LAAVRKDEKSATPEKYRSLFEIPEVSDLKRKAVKGAGASIIAQTISFFVRTGGVIILARLLKPRDFGLVAMVSAIFLLLMNFGLNGFTEYVIQKKDLTHKETSNLFWLHFIISLLLTIGLIAAAPLLAIFFKEPALKAITYVMSLGIMAQMLSTFHLALMKRKMNFGAIAFNNIVSSFISVILAVLMAIKGFGYWAVVTRQLSEIVVMSLGMWIICRWVPGLPGGFKNLLASLKYTINVYGNFILNYVERYLDKILLGRFHGSEVLGSYDRAFQLSVMPVAQLVVPLNNVGLATLSRLKDDPVRYGKYYKKALTLLSFVGVYASIFLTLLGDKLIIILLGPEWKEASKIVVAFGFGVVAMMLYSTYNWIHLSLGLPNRWLRWSIFSVLIKAVVIGISAIFGPVAVALSISISLYALFVPAIWYAGRPIGLKVIPIIRSILPYFLAGIGTTLLFLLSLRLFKGFSLFLDNVFWLINFTIILFLVTISYFVFIVIFCRSLGPLKEIFEFSKMIFKRKIS